MSVLSRYMFRQIAQVFLILIAVLTGLVWVSQAIRLLDLVIEKGRSLGEFLTLTGLLVPWIAGIVAPTALFIATVYVLFRFNADSEMVVVESAGGSQWRLLRPFAIAAVAVTAFIIFVNLVAMPLGMRAFREKLVDVRTDLIATLVQEGQFVAPESGLTVHIRARDNNGDLLGLIFHDTRQNDGEITYLAERARLISGERGSSLVMFNGTFQRRRETARDVDVVRFDEYTLDLSSFGPDREVPYYEASEKYMSELLDPDPEDPVFLSTPGKIYAEAHDRMSNPLYAFALMLVAFVGLGQAKSNRMGRIWLVLGVCGVALIIRILGATSINMMVKTPSLFPLAYAVPMITILSALTYLAYHGRGRGSETALAGGGSHRGTAPMHRPAATSVLAQARPPAATGSVVPSAKAASQPAAHGGQSKRSDSPPQPSAPRRHPASREQEMSAESEEVRSRIAGTGSPHVPDPNFALRHLARAVAQQNAARRQQDKPDGENRVPKRDGVSGERSQRPSAPTMAIGSGKSRGRESTPPRNGRNSR